MAAFHYESFPQSDETIHEAINVSAYCPSNLPQSADDWLRFMYSMGSLESPDRCIPSRRDVCHCANPIMAAPGKGRSWNDTFYRNLDLVQQEDRGLDVVLLGDSITEHWLGTDLGVPYKSWRGQQRQYVSLFYKSEGGQLDGLALGIGGDRTPNVLYRLLNGHHERLEPKIWWLLVGTNDAGGDYCSSQVIAAGNIKIAELLLQRQPDAKVVLNSLLPRGFEPMSQNVAWNILKQANDMLECYAATRSSVFFFNATDLFLEDSDSVNATMMEDSVHPNAIGAEVWGRAMIDYAINNLL